LFYISQIDLHPFKRMAGSYRLIWSAISSMISSSIKSKEIRLIQLIQWAIYNITNLSLRLS